MPCQHFFSFAFHLTVFTEKDNAKIEFNRDRSDVLNQYRSWPGNKDH